MKYMKRIILLKNPLEQHKDFYVMKKCSLLHQRQLITQLIVLTSTLILIAHSSNKQIIYIKVYNTRLTPFQVTLKI